MAYERLNLQDFIDVITAANLSHIEDGIVNNETKAKTIESTLNSVRNTANNNTNSINSLNTAVSEGEVAIENLRASEMINSVLPLWHTLLSNGGEKIYSPTISFDGNITGRTFLPLVPEGSEICIGYVHIGDHVDSYMNVMTCGGLYHFLLQYVIAANPDITINLDVNNEFGLQLFTYSMAARNWDGNAIIYNSEYLNLFSSLGLDLREVYPSFSLPAAFSIEESFEYNGIIYPSGFYSLYIQCNVIKESNASLGAVVPNLPLFYVDKFWALVNIKEGSGDLFTNQLNMSLNYSKASNAFECFGESIFWNGIDSLKTDATIPLDHETAPLKCISYNPQAFLQACLQANGIVMIDENWNSQNVTMTANTTETGANIYMLGNEILILPTVAYDGGIGLIPGVYVFDDQPFEIRFQGVDTQKIFNKHQINNQYLPEVPEFNLVEMGMANVPLTGNFTYLQANTTKLKFCSKKGPVRIIIPTEVGDISCLATFNDMGSAHQSVITGYYDATKFDTVIVFTDNSIGVAIIPISQMA